MSYYVHMAVFSKTKLTFSLESKNFFNNGQIFILKNYIKCRHILHMMCCFALFIVTFFLQFQFLLREAVFVFFLVARPLSGRGGKKLKNLFFKTFFYYILFPIVSMATTFEGAGGG